jgi:hypothetical protein
MVLTSTIKHGLAGLPIHIFNMTTNTTIECLVAQMGTEIGSLLRCIIQQEIQSHMDRINQLQNILQTGPCVTEPVNEVPSSQ